MKTTLAIATLALTASASLASVADFESLREGFIGETFTDNGITFSSLNDVAGRNPDGSLFEAGEYGRQFIIEDATFAINDFPGVLTGTNALSFGNSFIAGPNLSINILSSFHMTTGRVENYANIDLLMFENGPWGGLTLSLDATRNGTLVASDSFVISDLGGRDNLAGHSLTIDGTEFDSLQLSVRNADGTYAAFAGLVDNVNIVPAPTTGALLSLAALSATRRRRS